MDSRLEASLQSTLKRFYLIVGGKEERIKANWKQFELSLQSQRKDLLSPNQHHYQITAQAKQAQHSDEQSPQSLPFTNLPLASAWPNDFTFRLQNSQLYSSPDRRIIRNKFKSDSLEKTVLFALVFNHYFLCSQQQPIQQISPVAARIFEAIRQAMTNCAIQLKKGTSKERLKQLQVIRSLVGRSGESLNDKRGELLSEKIESLDNDYVADVFKALGYQNDSLIVSSQSEDFGKGYLSQMPRKSTNDLSKAAECLSMRIQVYEDKSKKTYGNKSALCCIKIMKSTRREKYTLRDIICYSQQDSSDDTNENPLRIFPMQVRLTTSI